MVICPDCGKRNLANLYCSKCGSDLYGKRHRPERSAKGIFDRPLVIR